MKIIGFGYIVAIVVMIMGTNIVSSSLYSAAASDKITASADATSGATSDEIDRRTHQYSKYHNEVLEYEKGEITQANQIQILIGIVIFLFGGNMWWIRNYMRKQEDKEESQNEINNMLFNEIKTANHTLDGLVGEHRRSMQFNGCAADPKLMEDIMRDIMKPFLEYHVHQRESDKVE